MTILIDLVKNLLANKAKARLTRVDRQTHNPFPIKQIAVKPQLSLLLIEVGPPPLQAPENNSVSRSA